LLELLKFAGVRRAVLQDLGKALTKVKSLASADRKFLFQNKCDEPSCGVHRVLVGELA
jgi:hypothetical protein